MPWFEAIPIKTERLSLRLLGAADVDGLYAIYSHPEVMRYWSWPAWSEPAQALRMVQDAHEGYHSGAWLQLGIERNEDRALVGACSMFHFHAASRRAEIGYALGRAFWSKGYMHEALQALVCYAFEQLDLQRLEADIDPRNTASARTLERLGFQKEGHLRERWIVSGEVSDSWIYGLLRREWHRQQSGRPTAAQAEVEQRRPPKDDGDRADEPNLAAKGKGGQ